MLLSPSGLMTARIRRRFLSTAVVAKPQVGDSRLLQDLYQVYDAGSRRGRDTIHKTVQSTFGVA